MLPEQAGDVRTLTRQAKITVTPQRVGPGSPVTRELVGDVAPVVMPAPESVSIPQQSRPSGGATSPARGRGAGGGRRRHTGSGAAGAPAAGGQGGRSAGGRTGGARPAGSGQRPARAPQGGSTTVYSSSTGGRSGAVEMSRGSAAGRRGR
jgi:hypothetical protein